jgi:hypothetical protein
VIPCGHTGEWAGVRRKSPTGFWVKRQVFYVLPQRDGGCSGLAGGEVSTRVVNKWHNAALVILGGCKGKERSGIDP